MSAMPIEDKVAMSPVAVPQREITAVHSGDKNIPINNKRIKAKEH